MSRNFRSGEFVSHGSGADLDNLPNATGGFTIWLWLFRGSNGGNQHLATKDSALDGWAFVIDNSPSEGVLLGLVQRATTDAVYISSTVAVPLYTPVFVAMTADLAASPVIKLYYGDQETAVAEVSYDTSQAGSGAIVSDAASNLYLGNLQRASSLPFLGSIQMGGIVRGDTLNASELETIRQATLNAVIDDPDLSDVAALFTHELLFNYQEGDVTDRSGNGNNGSVTGAHAGPIFPIETTGAGGLRYPSHQNGGLV